VKAVESTRTEDVIKRYMIYRKTQFFI